MIIFGIDPGTAVTGYGVIKAVNNSFVWQDSGVITTCTKTSLAERLAVIYESLRERMRVHNPDRVCIEEAFYGKNIHTALVLGHARGVAMLAAHQSGAAVNEYSPREVKKAVTGNGNSGKEQVSFMVRRLVSVPQTHELTDAYDALALAICDFNYGSRITIQR
jgi:crossover junction endodeoxyribonuclease RuvC